MKKKLILGLIAIVAVVGTVAGMSAYEAHVINVTAHIENALSVDTTPIEFGTVFPQEYLERNFTINLSESFLAAGRVDDVEYIINQKPKCKCVNNPEPCPLGEYAPVDYATHLCPEGYATMESLCPFLSKLPQDGDENDFGEPSYYDKGTNTCPDIQFKPASGKLTKLGQDVSDTWTVDLKVPPVVGTIGQDWPESCATWTVPVDGTDYGCDLWIEVTNISLPNGICAAKPDIMSVLDRSGSLLYELPNLKTAAHAFVTALDPKADGAHMGQTSFATNGTLDLHLTDNKTDIDNAIDGLVADGYTNLYEGILLANQELADGAHDRLDSESPDFMVIITDGEPNRPTDGPTARAQAKAQADVADANNTIIYVVGVGVTSANADWLKINIATSAGHYYDAANYSALEAILLSLASCN